MNTKQHAQRRTGADVAVQSNQGFVLAIGRVQVYRRMLAPIHVNVVSLSMRLYLRRIAAGFLASSHKHGKKMLKSLLLVVLTIAAAQANAEVFKCQGADGKIQFSDTACKAGNRSEVVPDRAPVTQQQQYEAQQRGQKMQNDAAALNAEKASAQAAQQAQQQRQKAETEAVVSKAAANDADAVAACVRDVERRGAAPNVKAELLAACRTAGLVQNTTGISSDAVSHCVKNVERMGASENEKARQLAICHGGDVPPAAYRRR